MLQQFDCERVAEHVRMADDVGELEQLAERALRIGDSGSRAIGTTARTACAVGRSVCRWWPARARAPEVLTAERALHPDDAVAFLAAGVAAQAPGVTGVAVAAGGTR